MEGGERWYSWIITQSIRDSTRKLGSPVGDLDPSMTVPFLVDIDLKYGDVVSIDEVVGVSGTNSHGYVPYYIGFVLNSPLWRQVSCIS